MRKLFLFSAAFAAAVFAVHYGAAPAALSLLVPALLYRGDRRLRCALVGLGLVLGFLWPRAYDSLFLAPVRQLEGQTCTVTVTVADRPWETSSGAGAAVRVEPEAGLPFAARFYGGAELLELRIGDRITAEANCRSAAVYREQETDTLTSKGIRLVLYARSELLAAAERPPLSLWPALALDWLKGRVTGLFPEDVSPLLLSLLTGDKSSLPDVDYAALRRAGLAHTVAVSGLHMTFLTGLVGFLLGRRRRSTALVSLVLVWFYALMTGATPSALRAAVMLTLLLLAPLLGREYDPPTSLAFALLVLLVQSPDAAGSVSLQFSFASVAGIFLFSTRFFDWAWERMPRPGLRPVRWVLRFLLSTLAVTLGALVFTTPLSVVYFGSVSLAAPLSSLVCLWAVTLAFSLGLLGALSGLPVLIFPAALLLRFLLSAARLLGDLSYSAISTDNNYILAALMFCCAVLAVFLLQRQARRPVIPLCACLLAVTASLWLTRLDFTLGDMTLRVFDVGQGQAVLLRAGDRVMLVDCGGNAGNAGDLCADYLATRGVRKLDLVILTHFHTDHANGVSELLARVPVDVLAAPTPGEEDLLAPEILALAESRGTQVVTVDEDQHWTLGSAELTLYAPLGAGQANESGLSVLCRGADFSALLTGDMDQVVEARLVKHGDLPHVDLLVAGHHGAKSSTSQELLDAVTPALVAVSCGYNPYGHPNPETLARVEYMGCAVYRTDLQGSLTVTVG